MRAAFLLAAAVAAQAPPAAPLPAALPIATLDVPQDKGAQEVQVLRREFPVGASSGWHVHPGVEVAYVLSGAMRLEMAGQPVRTLRAGESFSMPRGIAHNGTNVGRVPARLVITYLVDKGAPVRSAVPQP